MYTNYIIILCKQRTDIKKQLTKLYVCISPSKDYYLVFVQESVEHKNIQETKSISQTIIISTYIILL